MEGQGRPCRLRTGDPHQPKKRQEGISLRPGDHRPGPPPWRSSRQLGRRSRPQKVYGKHDAVNGVLTAFWALAVRSSRDPDFNRMGSKTNMSDAVWRADLGGRTEFRPSSKLDTSPYSGSAHLPGARPRQQGHRLYAIDKGPWTSSAYLKLGLNRR